MIHVLDLDPRLKEDSNYLKTMGSFGIVAHGFNNGLKKIGKYSNLENAELVGICDGLNLGFKIRGKKTFVIHVWDCINALPDFLLQSQGFYNTKLIGLSSQVSKLWAKYNVDCKTVMPGCDTDFWHSTKPKKEEFTFLFNSFGNVRSGMDLALEAFKMAFKKTDSVKLIIKNVGSSDKLKYIINEYSKDCNIVLIDERYTTEQMRDLYSECHVSLNVMRHSSWGLNVHEAAACGCIPLLGDFCPSNEMLSKASALFLGPIGHVDLLPKSAFLADKYGLHNAYGNFSYSEQPKFYEYDITAYSKFIKYLAFNVGPDYIKHIADPRKEVVQNWSWENSAKNLVKALYE